MGIDTCLYMALTFQSSNSSSHNPCTPAYTCRGRRGSRNNWFHWRAADMMSTLYGNRLMVCMEEKHWQITNINCTQGGSLYIPSPLCPPLLKQMEVDVRELVKDQRLLAKVIHDGHTTGNNNTEILVAVSDSVQENTARAKEFTEFATKQCNKSPKLFKKSFVFFLI